MRADDWADYLDPAEPDPALPDDERRALDRLGAALAAPDSWGEPPVGLRSKLLRAAREEQATVGTAGVTIEPVTGPPPPGAPGDGAAVVPLRRRSRRVWYVSGAGVAAAAVLVAVLAWPRPSPQTYDLAGTALAPRAGAVAELETRSAGLAIRLQIHGLPPAPAGEYYAAWLSGTGGIVPVGTFHWRKGGIPIDLWSGVSTDQYPQLFVSLQREGQPPTPTSQVVLSGLVRR